MLDLRRFFIIIFADRDISDEELRAFVQDHLARLSAGNDGGIFDARLTATTAVFIAFAGEVNDQDLTRALLKAATSQMEARWAAFLGWMLNKGKARIVDRAPPGSPLLAQFFPNGNMEYDKAKLQERETLLARVLNLVTGDHAANGTLLGADFVTQVTTLRDAFLTARGAQMGLKGERADNISDRGEARKALELQLQDNLLALAQLHKGRPEMAAVFFDQSLLEDRAKLPVLVSGSDGPGLGQVP